MMICLSPKGVSSHVAAQNALLKLISSIIHISSPVVSNIERMEVLLYLLFLQE